MKLGLKIASLSFLPRYPLPLDVPEYYINNERTRYSCNGHQSFCGVWGNWLNLLGIDPVRYE